MLRMKQTFKKCLAPVISNIFFSFLFCCVFYLNGNQPVLWLWDLHCATHKDCSGTVFFFFLCVCLYLFILFFAQSKSKVFQSIFLITLHMETCRTSEVKIKVLSVALREWLREVASSFIKLHLPLILAGGTSHVALSAEECSSIRCMISLLAYSQHGRKPLVLFIYLSRAQSAIFVWRVEFIYFFLLVSFSFDIRPTAFLLFPKRARITRRRNCNS